MANLYADGNYASPYLVSNVVSYPFQWPNNSTTSQFDLEYIQWANSYTGLALGTNSDDAPNAILVEQGPVRKIAPGVVRYSRVYCQLPVTWAETMQVAYTFPGLSAGAGSTWNPYFYRGPVTLYAIATVTHSYTSSESPPTLDNTFIVTDGGNVVDYIGTGNPNIGAGTTTPAIEPATYNVSSDSQLIKGLIWEKVSVVVPKPI